MSLSFWTETLDHPTLSVLPHDFLRPLDGRVEEATHSFPAPPTAQVERLAASVSGANAFTVGLAAFVALVYRLTGDDDLVFLITQGEKEFVLRVSVTASQTFSDLLSGVVAAESAAIAQYLPLATIVDHIQQRTGATPALYRLAFHDEAPPTLAAAVPGSVTDLAVFAGASTYTLCYNALLYRSERMTILGEQFTQLLALAETTPIGQISLITASQRAALPNPTADLDWLSYRGAIHDIFDANALAHPDRECVIETGSNRTFTYAHIREASNIVGHYLVRTGVRKGDVVMIYAHRGVDLMVAVMGTLKAGATFSVIDPAYPPARQNIYLQVARPRALVVLAKAGVLDPEVENYVETELDVVTRISALAIQDGGSLLGGAVAGTDCLSPYTHFASTPVGVTVGPDLNPTLSFTSGSEGIPKGVLGRHFSLAYYFPWMASRFSLSASDRFTMLSGIAHDPIQRDMFTPLFLGATLLVPTGEDIGTPGRLAAWMAEHGATVTHLTPAMGQLLLAQAVAEIPLLHHAFFVGDILTKRDCMRLQALAANVAIVNMYGTTETQRAVSYFEVPARATHPTFLASLKDVVPAGQGMLNVQLLVVNRNDRTQTCGVGEVGEIYVRAGGLAEGYRGLPELTAEKFVTNWFGQCPWEGTATPDNLGPRDRLYRTGDLGRYLPDGNVECSGRADDQVKIRGFRIELGEIDTHLSQHDGVRENITLVRRDANDEPVLVSYIVPKVYTGEGDDRMVAGIRDHADLVRSIKAHLLGRLASYAVPSLIIALPQLPLNPNGKVDKPKLVYPTLAQLEAAAAGAGEVVLTADEAEVRNLWLSVLPQAVAIAPEDSFFDVGGHSILATRMIFALRQQGVELALGAIFRFPTLREFALEVARVREGKPETTAKAALDVADYARDARELARDALAPRFPSADRLSQPSAANPLVVFLTGATGFLGAFLLLELLRRPHVRVIAHVRASTVAAGLDRLRTASTAFGLWDAAWESSIEVLLGDLSLPQFGLDEASWAALADRVDVVIHNGAIVHWVYPYATLRDANVVGTVNVLNLCSVGRAKQFSFVSSTAVLENQYFLDQANRELALGGRGLLESDPLEASATGLGTGYGQSKWAGEWLIREAGRRGLRGCITRPGYVVGHTQTGSQNTDDFLLRILKGCVEIGVYPDIPHGINMVPVDQVARVVVASALHPGPELSVAQVTGSPRIKLNEYVGALATYGYDVKPVSYDAWKVALEAHVNAGKESALYPLLHLVLDDLPGDTISPALDDTNARAALQADAEWVGEDHSLGKTVDKTQVGVYAAYLVLIGYLPSPPAGGEALPTVALSEETIALVKGGAGGRSNK